MDKIFKMEDFLSDKEKNEMDGRMRRNKMKGEEKEKSSEFMTFEIEARNLYKESPLSKFLLLDQFIKFYSIRKIFDNSSWKIKQSEEYKNYEKQFEEKTLEELKKDLDNLRYEIITSRESYSLALVQKLEEKTK